MPFDGSRDRRREAEALFEEHHDAVYRHLVRLLGDGDLAADLAQETFIRWVEREPDRDNPRAWLFTVAKNLARDHGRVSSRRLTLLEGSGDTVPMADAPPEPDHRVEAREREAAVRAALAELPERDRTILLMQQEGFKHREIAAVIDVHPKSVGIMLSRAMDRFMEALEPERAQLGRG